MYCVIQFYLQLRTDLAPHRPFLKVAAIKLVIFLSFWQSFIISVLTSSSLELVKPTKHIAYPDLKIGIPSLLLCIEMAFFSLLHLFAFPYKPYTESAKNSEPSKYPSSPMTDHPAFNELGPNQGGFLGIKAIIDAMNPWDLVKGFARGMRWLFVGHRTRETDESYNKKLNDMDLGAPGVGHARKPTKDLPIAYEFRRSNFGMPITTPQDEEGANLLAHAQPHPLNQTTNASSAYLPARQRYDAAGNDMSAQYDSPYESQNHREIGVATSSGPPQPYQAQVPLAQQYLQQKREQRQQRPTEPHRPANPAVIEEELWGADHGPHPGERRDF